MPRRRARPFAAPANLVRLSVGIESADDLVADLESARPGRGARQVTNVLLRGAARSPALRARARSGSYLVETDDGLALFDCGPRPASRRCETGSRRAASSSRDVRAPAPLAHPPRPRRVPRDARPRASGADRLGLGDRRAAPRRPVAARAERAPALRRLLRHALGRARGGAGGERAGRRRPRRRPRGLPGPGHASHHVCYFDGETLYAGDAAGVRIQPSRDGRCRRRRRLTSTSRPGTGRSRRSSAARPSGWR